MKRHIHGETREQREHLMNRAVADIVRVRMAASRLRQSDVARWSGVSRSYLQKVLRAESSPRLCVFLDLMHGLRIEDEHALWREVLARRDALRAMASRR
jgi:DNA-binding phage protein